MATIGDNAKVIVTTVVCVAIIDTLLLLLRNLHRQGDSHFR